MTYRFGCAVNGPTIVSCLLTSTFWKDSVLPNNTRRQYVWVFHSLLLRHLPGHNFSPTCKTLSRTEPTGNCKSLSKQLLIQLSTIFALLKYSPENSVCAARHDFHREHCIPTYSTSYYNNIVYRHIVRHTTTITNYE